jgi:hypothetical protein
MRAYKHNWVDFTAVPNEIFRHNLSLKAIGLYTYIANKPDGWDFSINGTSSQVSDGADSVRTAVKELEEAGFLKRVQERKSDGGFSDGIWYIYGTPLENPMTVKATSGNPRQVKTNKVKTKRERAALSQTDVSNEELAEKFGVKIDAVTRATQKYFLHCSDTGKKSTQAGLELWLTREQWGEDDYSIKKQNEMTRKALLEGFMG